MKIVNVLKTGDVLYRVDPRRLSVKEFTIRNSDEVYNYTTTTYENFWMECDKRPFQIPTGKFPIEFNGLLYFSNEDEANNFIKAQIGVM